ncbi:hypothetical protein PHLGIDRAFT_101272 [Phlebiopsis gigantea 11061_1 CR5-6]|uniref:Thioesterase domain-containing protein n=1 Tax=Phlebiopsis gigantea (strain 11061_1 CR5-6) TaxID=745531 RepID=A0A0C3NY83_PHLG1|nr:hypothetical protein PHLGIDRAFT_101272 [Phlebiopsis gigantea 11061_1 CR5-6]
MVVVSSTIRAAKGNVPQELKDLIAHWWLENAQGQGFGRPICEKLFVSEMQLFDNPEVPGKKEARVVFEIDVQEDMCNYLGAMHGGCTSFLIDLCSSITFNLIASHLAPQVTKHVSLSLNVTFHAPAVIGSKLRIVNTTAAFGKRVMTARSEVYDVTNGRICASGVHVKMPPSSGSPPKL